MSQVVPAKSNCFQCRGNFELAQSRADAQFQRSWNGTCPLDRLVEIFVLVLGQPEALRLVGNYVRGEDARTSFAKSSRSVYVREEFQAAQAVVAERVDS
jgi:hypothetical protein